MLPSLIQNHKKQEATAKLKKFNNTINNWLNLAYIDHGNPNYWNCVTGTGYFCTMSPDEFLNTYFKPYLNIAQITFGDYKIYPKESCNKENNNPETELIPEQSLIKTRKITIGGINQAEGGVSCEQLVYADTKIVLNDGLIIYIPLKRRPVTTPVLIDINGDKKPNQVGKDRFLFVFAHKTPPEQVCGLHAAKRYFCADGNVNNQSGMARSRKEALGFCKMNGSLCSLVLEYDNWEFKDDYPWKL